MSSRKVSFSKRSLRIKILNVSPDRIVEIKPNRRITRKNAIPKENIEFIDLDVFECNDDNDNNFGDTKRQLRLNPKKTEKAKALSKIDNQNINNRCFKPVQMNNKIVFDVKLTRAFMERKQT